MLINCSKCPTLVEDISNRRVYTCVETGNSKYMKNLYLFLSCAVNLKLLLKSNVLIKKKTQYKQNKQKQKNKKKQKKEMIYEMFLFFCLFEYSIIPM